MTDYIFTMKGVTKVHPPDKKIVQNLYLSFIPGAKIGVIGPNGMGKSSLLRIMAGEDKNYTGEAWIRPSATVGFVPQEPDIGKDRTVIDVVNEAVKPMRDALARFEAIG
ncbi:MAG: ATP-binding cassette domain-containing protein, partial [Deltaproteobacteria bacterium]